MKSLNLMFCIFLFLLSFAIAGHFGYKDELKERDVYCNMVKQGAWPDYKKIYKTECLNVDNKISTL